MDISIHSPHAGRDLTSRRGIRHTPIISIHSPHAGRDSNQNTQTKRRTHFNPLSPCGERRCSVFRCKDCHIISIHSPHAGRDMLIRVATNETLDFNPLSPCGERQQAMFQQWHTMKFQSTLPMRGETWTLEDFLQRGLISIHSPHAGRDPNLCTLSVPCSNFNPLSPCGERRFNHYINLVFRKFQSTLPMRGETDFDLYRVYKLKISIHSPHAGRDK